jgi:predicted SAM-dependent methyltransferase
LDKEFEDNMKSLNCGCGKDIREGWMNLDIRDMPGVDIVCDMTKGIPLDDGTIDEILARDVLEHFPLEDTNKILSEWNRVLKTEGTIIIEVPNVMMSFNEWRRGCLPTLYPGQSQTERFSQYIFGKQDYPYNFHYQLFDSARLTEVLELNGFHKVEVYNRGRALGARAKKA